MKSIAPRPPARTVLACLAVLITAVPAQAMDAAAAEQLLKDNKCTKCHDVARKKDGPAYRDVAARFKGEAGALDKVVHHMTAGEKVKFPDGHEESHKKLKASADETKALAQWLLTLEGGTKY